MFYLTQGHPKGHLTHTHTRYIDTYKQILLWAGAVQMWDLEQKYKYIVLSKRERIRVDLN